MRHIEFTLKTLGSKNHIHYPRGQQQMHPNVGQCIEQIIKRKSFIDVYRLFCVISCFIFAMLCLIICSNNPQSEAIPKIYEIRQNKQNTTISCLLPAHSSPTFSFSWYASEILVNFVGIRVR